MEIRPGNAQAVHAMVPWLKCLVMQPIYALPPRDAAFLPWNSTIMPAFPKLWRKAIIGINQQITTEIIMHHQMRRRDIYGKAKI